MQFHANLVILRDFSAKQQLYLSSCIKPHSMQTQAQDQSINHSTFGKPTTIFKFKVFQNEKSIH